MYDEPNSFDALKSQFKRSFQEEPTFIVVAPGRVNLLGEHTDYNLLPVAPMCIDREIVMAVRERNDAEVRLENTDPAFSGRSFSVSGKLTRGEPGDWANYAKAAIDTLIPFIEKTRAEKGKRGAPIRGFEALTCSNLPPAAGLSSSSAMVVASCLAFCAANGFELEPAKMAELMRKAERFVGTAGGGMDQAVISLSEPDEFLLIEFDPLKAAPLPLPTDARIFIVDSGEKADKALGAKDEYNRRAVECLLAMHVMRKFAVEDVAWKDELPEAGKWASLRDVYNACRDAEIAWQQLLYAAVSRNPYSPEELFEKLGRDVVEQVCATRQMPALGGEPWCRWNGIVLYERAAHVFAESDRVFRLSEAVKNNDMGVMATLMNEGHASCRDLFHLSTPRIERMIARAHRAGAFAARITGAGFGGCIVVLVAKDEAENFVRKFWGEDPAASEIIAAKCNGGARVVAL